MALLGMDVAQGAMKISRIQREMFNPLASLALRSLTLSDVIQTFFPVAPVSLKESFLFLVCSVVKFIGSGQGEAQGLFKLSENEMPGHELAAAGGAETLLVKIIRQSISADFFERFLGITDFLLAQIANGDAKTVPANVLRAERRRRPAEIFDAQASLLESPLGAVKDGDVLDGEGVTILEAAEPDTLPLDFPAPPNELQSIDRVEIPLL